jgi:hypothetical protein
MVVLQSFPWECVFFVKALLGNSCIYLLIKNLLPSSRCSFVVVSRLLPSNGPKRYSIHHHENLKSRHKELVNAMASNHFQSDQREREREREREKSMLFSCKYDIDMQCTFFFTH